MFVSAILLAAGESTRMGRQKALLPWEGATLLEYQLAQLSAIEDIREIIVVTGHEPDRIAEIASATDRTCIAHNTDYRTGKASSVRTGVHAASDACGAILLLAVDQPRPASLHRRVVDEHAGSPEVITVPMYRGRRGHPVIFSAALRGELAAVRDETLGVRELLRLHGDSVLLIEVSDAAVLVDLNSPGDLPSA